LTKWANVERFFEGVSLERFGNMQLDLNGWQADETQRLAGIIGIDEAGRGPLVGDVFVAAVVLNPDQPIEGLADSKTLTEARRESLAARIKAQAWAWHVCRANPQTIAQLNILQATLACMREAAWVVHDQMVREKPDLAFVIQIDGNRLPQNLPCAAEAIVKGDQLISAISAASILAKTARDQSMRELDADYPMYGFAKHKGYGTKQHLAAIAQFGVLPMHRPDFAPVREALAQGLIFSGKPCKHRLERK
jgi:ribonuclease HII